MDEQRIETERPRTADYAESQVLGRNARMAVGARAEGCEGNIRGAQALPTLDLWPGLARICERVSQDHRLLSSRPY